MQNGQKTMMNKHRPKSARPFANRSKQVDIQCCPARAEGFWKRAKKL